MSHAYLLSKLLLGMGKGGVPLLQIPLHSPQTRGFRVSPGRHLPGVPVERWGASLQGFGSFPPAGPDASPTVPPGPGCSISPMSVCLSASLQAA